MICIIISKITQTARYRQSQIHYGPLKSGCYSSGVKERAKVHQNIERAPKSTPVNYPDLRLTPKRSELVTALRQSGFLLHHYVDWHRCQMWRYIKARCLVPVPGELFMLHGNCIRY